LLTTLIANLSKQLSNSLSQASMSPMDGSKYPCKPAWKPRTAKEMGIERSDNSCHQFSLFSLNAWLLSHDTQLNFAYSQIFGLEQL